VAIPNRRGSLPRLRRILTSPVCFIAGFLLAAALLEGQQATSAEEIERLRQQKAQQLQPETLPWLHRTVLSFREAKVQEKLTYGYRGFRPRFGTLGPGSGFGVGIEYFRPNLMDDRFLVRSSLTGSLQDFFMIDGEFEARRLAGKGFVNLLAFHRFSPKIDFFGEGPESSIHNRTAYSLEENSVQASAGWQIKPRVRAGGLIRYLKPNVGPTRDGSLPSTEAVFAGSAVPGLGLQPPFVQTGAFIELQPSRELGAPPGGTTGLFRWSRFDARERTANSFTRVEAQVERHQLFFNHQRNLLLRARTVLSIPDKGNEVPFYLQPQLGGPWDLRGFRGRRFYDNNLALVTAEYQWQVFSGVSLALFMDAGKVFPHWDRWSLGRVEKSYGGGLRFGNGSFAGGRFDLAFSREGVQLWIVFDTF